jgi:hypothetical protein
LIPARAFLRRPRIDAEVDEEVRFHVEQEIAAQVARGVEAGPSEARQDVYTSDR